MHANFFFRSRSRLPYSSLSLILVVPSLPSPRSSRPSTPACPPSPSVTRAPRPAPRSRPEQSHTIVLLQTAPSATSRTYFDFDSKAKALDFIIKMFEDRLKAMTPDAPKITYDVMDLFRYLDNLVDVSALVLDTATKSYTPLDKEGLRSDIYTHLKNMAGGGGGGSGKQQQQQQGGRR